MTALAALLVASIGTFALRYLSVRSFSKRTLDARIDAVLRHAALAIMASLVISSLPTDGQFALNDAAATTGVGVAVVAGRRLDNVSIVIALAVASYAAAQAIAAA